MRLTLKLDEAALERLMAQASAEKRPLAWQAEVLLRRALGLPFPQDRPEQGRKEADDAA